MTQQEYELQLLQSQIRAFQNMIFHLQEQIIPLQQRLDNLLAQDK